MNIRINEHPIIKAILVVLNNDQSTEFRRKHYEKEKRYISSLAERILLEEELENIPKEMENEKRCIDYKSKVKKVNIEQSLA